MTEAETPASTPAKRKYIRKVEPQIEVLPEPTVIPRKKICILGTTGSRGMAPFADDTWEFWTIGPGGKDNNRWDALFELHGASTWPEGFQQYIKELSEVKPEQRMCEGRTLTKAVYTMAPMQGWLSNIVFPKREIEEKYGKLWMSSSISWALALAMEMGATDIGIYGIDLESGEEYVSQFPGARHLIDMARARGINIYMPAHCGLLRDPAPYPDRWETHFALLIESKLKALEPALAERNQAYARLAAEINSLDGQISVFKFLRDQFVFGSRPLQ